MPMPTAVAVRGKQGNGVDEFALAYSASTELGAEFVLPIVDVNTDAFKEIQEMPTTGTRILLYKAA
jgi:hypothetical protein